MGIVAGALRSWRGIAVLAALLAVGFAALSFGAKVGKDDALAELRRLVTKTESSLADISGDVAIRIRQESGERQIEGNFAYLKGYALRVEYHKPERQVMLLTQEELNIYFPKINQLIHDRPRAGARLYYLDLVRGFSRYFKEGRVKSARRGEDGSWHVTVRGHEGEEMKVRLRGDDALPQGISAAGDGVSTRVRFSKLAVNQGLKQQDLELRLPEDVDVVEMEGFSY